MSKHFTILVVALFLSGILTGQTISGKLTDPSGAPAGFATLRLLQARDSVFIKGISADAAGEFMFKDITPGAYFIKAALLGYEDLYTPVLSVGDNEEKQLDVLHFQPARALQTVTIRAQRPLIENQLDKVVVNVAGSALATGNNAFELLQRSPGVVITPQDNILLQGKGNTVVMIDGRPVQMNAAELAAFLKSTPGESIQSIELIAHPSSKYEAEGIGGIINIRLKKSQNLGANGSLSLGNTQSTHRRLRAGVNLNERLEHVNFYGNYYYVNAGQSISQYINREIGGKNFEQNTPKIDEWNSHHFKTGADWFFNDRNTLGAFVSGNVYDNTTHAGTTTYIRQSGAASIDSTLLGALRNPEYHQRLNYNLNYRFADTLGHEWTIDLDRIDFHLDGHNQLQNNLYDARQLWLASEGIRSDLGTTAGIWSAKTDYIQTRKNGLKIETGLKATWSDTDNRIVGADAGNDAVFAPDAGRTNQAVFSERIAAGYVNVGKQSQKWGWQAGLRAENTDLRGTSTDLQGQAIVLRDQHFLDLFPTAFVQYQLSANGQLGASYGRRISRASYQDLNPFVWQIDPYTSERGNPNLAPAYTHSMELKYTYKYAASLSLGYSRTNHLVSTVARQVGEQLYTQPENLAHQDNISMNLNFPTPITSWWEGYVWLGVWHNRFQADLPEGRLDTRSFGGGSWLNQQFKLSASMSLECSMWTQFPSIDGMVRNKGIWSVDLGWKKKMLNDKLTLQVSIYDVFHTQRWEQTVDFGNVHGFQRNRWESQALAVSVGWNFGGQQGKGRDRRSGAEEEVGRIKAKDR